MLAILRALGRFATDLFKSRCRLKAENLLLRYRLAGQSAASPIAREWSRSVRIYDHGTAKPKTFWR